MTFATKSVATALKTLAENINGVHAATIGVPETISNRVHAIITAAGQDIGEKTTGTLSRGARYMVNFAYRLDGAETTAEEALMDIIDLFQAALFADRTLGGVCTDIRVDVTLPDAPDYQTRAGKEFREFPVMVTAMQRGAFTINP